MCCVRTSPIWFFTYLDLDIHMSFMSEIFLCYVLEIDYMRRVYALKNEYRTDFLRKQTVIKLAVTLYALLLHLVSL